MANDNNLIDFYKETATQLNLKEEQVKNVLQLVAEAATIPFIARYRKDKTGALDEVQIANIIDTAKSSLEFHNRKASIIKSITDQGKMTDALLEKIESAEHLNALEDIYLPYKPKRKTKAQNAKEQGLEPLAQSIFEQSDLEIEALAQKYFNEVITSVDQALQGARDIIAEWVNEDFNSRNSIRNLFEKEAQITAKLIADKEQEAQKYKDYFDFKEPISKIPSHRFLALLRGFMEGYLRVEIAAEEDNALALLEKQFILSNNDAAHQVKRAIKDAYRRLMQPSMEAEFRSLLKTKADEEAIQVFAENLKQLLLASPLGSKNILAIDPGYRTGCKVVCLDATGALKTTDLIYIHENNHRLIEAENIIKNLVAKYTIEAFAIGDGTAGRETEQFVKKLQLNIPIFLVNEDGASVYSASETARQEFPDYDITVRGSVSIGRRLMDPLAELVKIDPKSIGVGQYQHDVNPIRLKEKLDQTVESCVNKVGVNLNTASKHLLSYISGIGPSLAENIIQYRNEHGHFSNRNELLQVPRLGQKAFEQCAGFLRIPQSNNSLDKSAVHPEAYSIVENIAKSMQLNTEQLIGNEKMISQINPQQFIDDKFGIHAIQDILNELKKPGLDPRKEAQVFEFADVYKIEDLSVGAILPGVVTNITRFGAFVDIGVKQDGLVHISEIAHQYITDPNEVLKLNQKVQVKITDLDIERKRIALSIKQCQENNKASKYQSKQNKHHQHKENNNTMADALQALKKKFS